MDAVYALYSNCRSLFDICVSDSSYQIFPYNGTHSNAEQIEAMARSDACAAVFTAVMLSNLTACTMSDLPLTAAVETLLKIRVDLQEENEESPTAERFQELLAWRYTVDLATAAGVPDDSDSELYSQYESNLASVLDTTTIVVNEDYSVDVQLTNGSYVDIADGFTSLLADGSTATTTVPTGAAQSKTSTSTSSASTSSDAANTETSGAASIHTRGGQSWWLWPCQAAVGVVVAAAHAW